MCAERNKKFAVLALRTWFRFADWQNGAVSIRIIICCKKSSPLCLSAQGRTFFGADDGNRTRVFGLGSGHSAIELHLRGDTIIIRVAALVKSESERKQGIFEKSPALFCFSMQLDKAEFLLHFGKRAAGVPGGLLGALFHLCFEPRFIGK